jgi:ribokinase
MHRVITIGAATIDCLMKSKSLKVAKSHETPGGLAMCEVIGGKMEAEEGLLTTGGGGTNVAVGLRRLGQSVKVISRVGNDDLAEMVVKKLSSENVNSDLMQYGTGRTGLSTILVAENGGRSIITYRGESGNINGSEINWSEVEKAEWIQISSLGGNIELLEDLVKFADSKKIKVGLNPGKAELDQKEKIIKLLPHINFINLNKMEAATLWNVDFEDEKLMMQKFISNGSLIIAITDGKRGASMVEKNKWIKMTAFPNKSVDDTGAGDAFVSGAVTGILNGNNLAEILKMGLANGGSAVTVLGAKEGLLHTANMQRYLVKQLKTIEEIL